MNEFLEFMWYMLSALLQLIPTWMMVAVVIAVVSWTFPFRFIFVIIIMGLGLMIATWLGVQWLIPQLPQKVATGSALIIWAAFYGLAFAPRSFTNVEANTVTLAFNKLSFLPERYRYIVLRAGLRTILFTYEFLDSISLEDPDPVKSEPTEQYSDAVGAQWVVKTAWVRWIIGRSDDQIITFWKVNNVEEIIKVISTEMETHLRVLIFSITPKIRGNMQLVIPDSEKKRVRESFRRLMTTGDTLAKLAKFGVVLVDADCPDIDPSAEVLKALDKARGAKTFVDTALKGVTAAGGTITGAVSAAAIGESGEDDEGNSEGPQQLFVTDDEDRRAGEKMHANPRRKPRNKGK